MRDKILIISDNPYGEETSADIILKRIEELGTKCIYLRLSDLAEKQSSLNVSYDGGKQNIFYKKNDETIDLHKEIKSVLFWRPSLPDEIKNKMEGKTLEFYKGEWTNFMKGIYLSLKDCFWMNPYPWNSIYEEKLYQLKLAQEVGFQIPKSFITTSLDEAHKYFESIDTNVVYKPFSQIFWEEKKENNQSDIYLIYTNIIDKKDLINSKDVYATPNIFQSYVSKKIELRITCVGKAVMACEIHSQDSKVSKHDWRKYDLDNTPYLKHNLPKNIEQLCLKYLDNLGLTYGCIDMILSPDDEYIFLELNPNGQYGWIEELSKFPITENIARMLIKASVDYDIKRW